MTALAPLLTSLGAHETLIEWAANRECDEKSYLACDQGDELLWFATLVGVDRRVIMLTACACIEPILMHWSTNADNRRIAIETARAWALGCATAAECHAIFSAFEAAGPAEGQRDDAFYASSTANCAVCAALDIAYAANDVDEVANAARDAVGEAAFATAYADARVAAAYTSDGAYTAAYDAAFLAVNNASLLHSADLVRARIPWTMLRDACAKLKVTK